MIGTVAGMLAALMLAAGCARQEAPSASDAWVRLAAVPGRPAAGYFALHGGAKPARLSSVAVAGVPRVEMHESRMAAGGMMAMDAVAEVPVPAGGTVAFAPAGYHVMLFGVPESVKPGATLTMRFRFADGSAAEAPAKVVGAGEAGLE